MVVMTTMLYKGAKMPQFKENILEIFLFRFESCSCDCVVDLEYITPGEDPLRKYKLQALPESKLLFAYAAKQGLVRIATNGTIEETNILGKLMALSKKSEKELFTFMKKNGFLFSLSSTVYEELDATTLFSIIERLRMTVELMTAANEIHKDYQKIFHLTIKLLLSSEISIKMASMHQSYSTKHYTFVDLLQSSNFTISYEKEHEAFNSDFYTVSDTIYGSYQLSVQEYNDIIGGYSTTLGFNDLLFQKVTGLYLNLECSGIDRNITDLLFHYFHEVGMLDLSNGLAYYQKPNLDAFSKEMKQSLIEIARFIIGEEINANLGGIHPVYNSDTMTPSWKVDNLLCALYFSIFYLRPDLEVYRPCSDPKCGNYFLVKTTSTNKRYCSVECCNRTTQARYRKNHRERKESEP